MSAKNLMINCVEAQYTQQYIANVFWSQHIAKVSKITLIPYLKNTEIYNIAYIEIGEWCDSESAYNFIKRVNNPEKEARIVHNDDDWWPVQLNTHNNGDVAVGIYTVVFDPAYFEEDESDLEDEIIEPTWGGFQMDNIYIPPDFDGEDYDDEVSTLLDEELHDDGVMDIEELYDEEYLREHPIRGQDASFWSVNDAKNHIRLLRSLLGRLPFDDERNDDIHDEINHFENELRIHDAVQRSANVTQRKKPETEHQELLAH